MKTTIVIPTLTNTAGLHYELKALSAYPIVVVDNAPTKDKQLSCQKHPQCIYLPQVKNLGFARAINLASNYVKTEWICILNDDIEFISTPPISALIELAKEQGWDAISPLLQKKSGEIENLGYRVLPVGRTEPVFSNSTPLHGLTAACLVIKTKVFRSLHGFDSRFFAYLEDVDLFLRLRHHGYKFGVASEIKVIHHHMTTSRKMDNFKSMMDLKNWIFVIVKNWSWHDLILNFPAILVERLRNFSGFIKSTWASYGYRSIFVLPRDLLWIIKELLIFPFSNKSTI